MLPNLNIQLQLSYLRVIRSSFSDTPTIQVIRTPDLSLAHRMDFYPQSPVSNKASASSAVAKTSTTETKPGVSLPLINKRLNPNLHHQRSQ